MNSDKNSTQDKKQDGSFTNAAETGLKIDVPVDVVKPMEKYIKEAESDRS